MTNYLIIPGLGNSGEEHWQTHFERSSDHFKRVNQREWDAPDWADWIETIEKAVYDYPLESVVLVGHSLGCVTIVHWALKYAHRIKGALLVGPSDIESPAYEFAATGFAPIPLQPLNFKTIVVASSNDPWVSMDRANYFAEKWGSELVPIGAAGHINAASGYGPWEQGMQILKRI